MPDPDPYDMVEHPPWDGRGGDLPGSAHDEPREALLALRKSALNGGVGKELVALLSEELISRFRAVEVCEDEVRIWLPLVGEDAMGTDWQMAGTVPQDEQWRNAERAMGAFAFAETDTVMGFGFRVSGQICDLPWHVYCHRYDLAPEFVSAWWD